MYKRVEWSIKDVLLEDQSRNTVENVTNTLKMLKDSKNTTFTVITSDFHTWNVRCY